MVREMAYRVVLCCVLLISLVLGSCADSKSISGGQTVDASSAWNAVCGEYNFSTTAAVAVDDTFADAYTGSDLMVDLVGILNDIAQTLATNPPFYDGDDLMRAGIENWPL